MRRIHVRSFFQIPQDVLWEKLKGGNQFILIFDDGELPVTTKDVLFTFPIWDLFKEYSQVPILKHHILRSHLKNGELDVKSHIRLIETVCFHIYDYLVNNDLADDPHGLLEHLYQRAYEKVNEIYNVVSCETEAYVIGYDILDLMEITNHPVITQGLETMSPDQKGIDMVYGVAKELILESDELLHNHLIRGIRAGIVKYDQALQCTVLRGYLTNIASWIFSKPILRSFTSGLVSITDWGIESCSAAKALASATGPLQKAEYFSRRQTHMGMKIQRLHRGDCGSKKYLNWLVRGPLFDDNGKKLNDGDLPLIQGKNYIDDEGNIRVIKKSDKHLIGTYVRLRSVIAGCAHPDPFGICETCYGDSATSIPARTNIGAYATHVAMQKVTQKVISIKHYDGSSVVDGVVLKGKEVMCLWAKPNGNDYYLNKSILKYAKVSIVISPKFFPGVIDVSNVDDVRKLDLVRVSTVPKFVLSVVDHRGVIHNFKLEVALNNRKPYFSHEFLQYVKDHSVTTDARGQIIVDLSDWDSKQILLCLPLRHFNMSDHQKRIEKALERELISDDGTDEEVKTTSADRKKGADQELTNEEDVPLGTVIVQFFDLVNKKITVALSVCEILVYQNTIADASRKIARPFKAWDPSPSRGRLYRMYLSGSLGASMAYQEHRTTLTDPEQFLNTNPIDHPFDWALDPSQVWTAKYKGTLPYYSC